jgi:SAM-dependent methyltransferase
VNCPICGYDQGKLEFNFKTGSYRSCQSCTVWYNDPLPSDDDITNYYVNASKEGSYDLSLIGPMNDERKGVFRNYVDVLLKRTGLKIDNIKCLDIGCFDGTGMSVLSERGCHNVWGIEMQKSASEVANSLFPGRIFNGNFLDMDISIYNNFDLLIMTDVLEHLKDPKAALEKASTLLKPGGFLFITTPDNKSFISRIMGKNWPSLVPVHHIFLFNQNSLKSILDYFNFKPIYRAPLFKTYSIKYVLNNLINFKPNLKFVLKIIPSLLLNLRLPFSGGELLLIAQKKV